MKQQKILYISAMWLWDNILSIPFLLKLKKKWYHVILLRYHPRYFWKHFFYTSDDILNFYYENNLIDDVLIVPHNKFKLLFFVLKSLWKFDKVYIPTKTNSSLLWARLLWKKKKYFFEDINDTALYDWLVQWLLEDNTVKSLFEFKKHLKFPIDKSYVNKFWIKQKFVTIFPSIFERSIDAKEWNKVISFLEKQWFQIILIWWSRENWLYEDLKEIKYKDFINLCWKTDFIEIKNILSDSQINISANWGMMRLGHLLNKNNISIHTVSWYITQPPVDNIHSFNIRKYTYPACKPCESTGYRFFWQKGIPCCAFAWTEREGECRKAINGEDIINCIEKILS